jgi:hypothetical protein
VATPGLPRVVVVGSGGATYEMFELERSQDRTMRLRGPILLEIGEEVSLQIELGTTASTARARISGHEDAAGEPVTIAVLIDPSPDVMRMLRPEN